MAPLGDPPMAPLADHRLAPLGDHEVAPLSDLVMAPYGRSLTRAMRFNVFIHLLASLLGLSGVAGRWVNLFNWPLNKMDYTRFCK